MSFMLRPNEYILVFFKNASLLLCLLQESILLWTFPSPSLKAVNSGGLGFSLKSLGLYFSVEEGRKKTENFGNDVTGAHARILVGSQP